MLLDYEEREYPEPEEVKAMLADTKKPPSPNYEKDGWSAILLASCNGNESIVRELIKKEQVLFFKLTSI